MLITFISIVGKGRIETVQFRFYVKYFVNQQTNTEMLSWQAKNREKFDSYQINLRLISN